MSRRMEEGDLDIDSDTDQGLIHANPFRRRAAKENTIRLSVWHLIGLLIATSVVTCVGVYLFTNLGTSDAGHSVRRRTLTDPTGTSGESLQSLQQHNAQLQAALDRLQTSNEVATVPQGPNCPVCEGDARECPICPTQSTAHSIEPHPRADPDFDWAFYVRPQVNVRFPSDSFPYLRKDGFPCHYTDEGKPQASADDLFQCVQKYRNEYGSNPDQHKQLDCRSRRKVFDTFKFNNELNLLETRMANNWDVTDFFVIIESNQAYAGQKKEYAFGSHYANFTQYMSKIIHVRCELSTIQIENDNEKNDGRGWLREEGSSDCLKFGLGMADPDDIIIVGDTDEIPRPEVLSALQMCSDKLNVLTPPHPHYQGYGEDNDRVIRLAGPKWVSSWKWEQIMNDRPDGWVANSIGIRKQTYNKATCWYRNNPPSIGLIRQACWHCSGCFFGDVEANVKKLTRYSELGWAREHLADMADLEQYTKDPSKSKKWAGQVREWQNWDYLPKYVREHPERYKDQGWA